MTAASSEVASCAKPAKLILYVVGDGNKLAAIGTYCIDHFHAERGVLRSQGCRTGVAIIHEPKPIACLGREE